MFKKGDKVKIIGGYFKGETGEVIDFDEDFEMYLVDGETVYAYVFGKNLRLVPSEYTPSQEELNYIESDVDMTDTAYKRLEVKQFLNSLYGTNESTSYCDTDSVTDILKPNHYQGKNGDLFDEWYERYPFEVFRIVLLATAERYFRRYHLKDGLDGLNKGIEVMKRLEEYELKEENND